MDDFELEIKKEFLNEALMNLEEVESSFMELETTADAVPLLEKIFRLAHNLKGGSVAVGFEQVTEVTHQLESLVLKIQKKEIALCADLITTLLKSNDTLVEMHVALKADLNAKFQNAEILAEIKGWLTGSHAPKVADPVVAVPAAAVAVEKNESEVVPVVPSAETFFVEEVVPAVAAVTPKAQPKTPAAPPSSNDNKVKEDEVIRVNMSKIDMLNDFVGELIVLQSVVEQQTSAFASPQLNSSMRQLVKLSKDIQSLSMSLRMLPIKPLVQKLQRVVRDTAQSLGKEAVLEVVGEHLDVDKSVLDKLADPLIHILRNAADHGLEGPMDRVHANKNIQGKIVASFVNQGNHLIVEVKDDGNGINLDRVRAKAIEKNIITEAQQLTEKQMINLIFHPGFSTKAEANEISGRGVGMDVVKTNIEKIGGTVDVKTVRGHGSVFTMQIPLSLAVIDGLVVSSPKGRYVIPLSQIQETINLRSQKVFANKLGIGSCFELRDTVVPLFSIEQALMGKSHDENLDLQGTALIIHVNEKPVALVVQDILRSQQIVVKPFTNGIKAQKGWLGSCVLGDGLPTLILSPIELLNTKLVTSLGESHLEGVA